MWLRTDLGAPDMLHIGIGGGSQISSDFTYPLSLIGGSQQTVGGVGYTGYTTVNIPNDGSGWGLAQWINASTNPDSRIAFSVAFGASFLADDGTKSAPITTAAGIWYKPPAGDYQRVPTGLAPPRADRDIVAPYAFGATPRTGGQQVTSFTLPADYASWKYLDVMLLVNVRSGSYRASDVVRLPTRVLAAQTATRSFAVLGDTDDRARQETHTVADWNPATRTLARHADANAWSDTIYAVLTDA